MTKRELNPSASRRGYAGVAGGLAAWALVASALPSGAVWAQTAPISTINSAPTVGGGRITLSAPVRGGSCAAGGTVEYSVQIGNPTGAPQDVTLAFDQSAYAAMVPTVTPDSLHLAPGETRMVTVRVPVPARIPPGGRETQTLRAVVEDISTSHVSARVLEVPTVNGAAIRLTLRALPPAVQGIFGVAKTASSMGTFCRTSV